MVYIRPSVQNGLPVATLFTFPRLQVPQTGPATHKITSSVRSNRHSHRANGTATNLLATPTRQEGVGAGTFRLACCLPNAFAGTHSPPLKQRRCPLGLHQNRCRRYFPLWQIHRRRSCCCCHATRERGIPSRPGQPAPYVRVEREFASMSECENV